MPSKSKAKGNRFERAVVNIARDMGLPAQRAWASDGRSLGLHQEVDVVINGRSYQCKRRKKIAGYLLPSDNVHGQIISQDRGQTYIVLRLRDYLDEQRGNDEEML